MHRTEAGTASSVEARKLNSLGKCSATAIAVSRGKL